MNACIGVGRLDEASALLEGAVAAGVRLDARAYNVLLKGHARAGDPDALAGIVAHMREAQVCFPALDLPRMLLESVLACTHHACTEGEKCAQRFEGQASVWMRRAFAGSGHGMGEAEWACRSGWMDKRPPHKYAKCISLARLRRR